MAIASSTSNQRASSTSSGLQINSIPSGTSTRYVNETQSIPSALKIRS